MAGVGSSTVLSVGISEAYTARREAQRTQNDSPAFQESDRKLSRNRENALDGRGSQSVEQASGKHGFSRELSPEQRKEAEVIRRGDTRIRPYESAYLTRSYGAVASGGNFAVTYGADGKLPTTGSSAERRSSPTSGAVAEAGGAKALAALKLADTPATQTDSAIKQSGAVNVPNAPDVPDAPSVTQAGKSVAPPPREIAEAQLQTKIETAADSRTQRENRQTQRGDLVAAVSLEAKRNGEAQNVEPVSPSEKLNAINRQRLADAYQTVPREAAATVSLFV